MYDNGIAHCPVCAAELTGWLERADGVRLTRICREHGRFSNLLYSSEQYSEICMKQASAGNCGSEKCLVVEITERCDVGCATCSACSVDKGLDESMVSLLERVRAAVQKTNARVVALSGGEPLMRDDVWVISDFISQYVDRVVLITSGRNFEHDDAILQEIAARREWLELYLQFDSLDSRTLHLMRTPSITPNLRKMRLKLAIETGAIVSAVCVVSDFANDEEIKHITDYLQSSGAGGVTFQPLRELGRFPAKRGDTEYLRTVDGIQRAALDTISPSRELTPFAGQPFDMTVSWANGTVEERFFTSRSPGEDFRIATSSYWDFTNYFSPLAEGSPGYFYISDRGNQVRLLNQHYFNQTLSEYDEFNFLKADTRLSA